MGKITIERETLERAVDILDRRLNWNPVVDKLCSEINAALAAQPADAQPVAWKHDCAGLCTNGVELWIDACPHCGKPRPVPPAPAAVPPGYVLVPVEPTYEINKAIRMAVRAGCFDDGIYRAMIAAAGDKP